MAKLGSLPCHHSHTCVCVPGPCRPVPCKSQATWNETKSRAPLVKWPHCQGQGQCPLTGQPRGFAPLFSYCDIITAVAGCQRDVWDPAFYQWSLTVCISTIPVIHVLHSRCSATLQSILVEVVSLRSSRVLYIPSTLIRERGTKLFRILCFTCAFAPSSVSGFGRKIKITIQAVYRVGHRTCHTER